MIWPVNVLHLSGYVFFTSLWEKRMIHSELHRGVESKFTHMTFLHEL